LRHTHEAENIPPGPCRIDATPRSEACEPPTTFARDSRLALRSLVARSRFPAFRFAHGCANAFSRCHAARNTPLPRRNSPLSCFPPFLSVALRMLSTHIERASSLRCQKRTALPRRSLLARFAPASRPCRGTLRRSPTFRPQDGCRNPSALSSSSCGRHHPIPHERAQDCLALTLAADALLRIGRSYSSLLPCVQHLKHLADERGTEEPSSAAAADPRLVRFFAHAFTSLGAEPQVIPLYVRPPGAPQSPRTAFSARFLGGEARSPPLPLSETLLTVWHRLRMH